MDRICSQCGCTFDGISADTLCEACRMVAKIFLNSRICSACGAAYTSRSPRSAYCPACRKHHQSDAPKRSIGSSDKCELCGAEYTVKGSAQRYCPECAKGRARRAYAERKSERIIATANCIVCGNPFPLDGHRRKCCSEECAKVRQKQMGMQAKKRDPEKARSYVRAWYAEHKEEYNEKRNKKRREQQALKRKEPAK